MNYRPYTLRMSPHLTAALLGIAWRLLLPVIALAALLETADWLQPRPPLDAASRAPADEQLALTGLQKAMMAFGEGLQWALVLLLAAAVFLALLVVQAFWSPLPSYQRHLHGRPWRFGLGLGLAAGCWLVAVLGKGFPWLVSFELGCGALALGLPSLVEWLARDR